MATKRLSPTIESILRLLAFVPLLFVFFCLGYFVLGKRIHSLGNLRNLPNYGDPAPASLNTPNTPVVIEQTSPSVRPNAVVVIDNTAAIDAMHKREDLARKAAAKRKANEAARRKNDEIANLLTATPAPMTTPAPDSEETPETTASPDPDESPASDANPTNTEESTPPASASKSTTNSDNHHPFTGGVVGTMTLPAIPGVHHRIG